MAFSVYTKKIFFQSLLTDQIKETADESSVNNDHLFINLNETNENVIKHKIFILNIHFIIESMILAVLDSDDYICTVSEIIGKMVNWFPQIHKSHIQMKRLIDFIANSLPYNIFEICETFFKASISYQFFLFE